MSEVTEINILIPGDEPTRANVEVVRNHLKELLGIRRVANSTVVRYVFNRVAHEILTQSENNPEKIQEIQDGEKD